MDTSWPRDIELTGFEGAVIGKLPIGNQFSVFAKGGIIFWDESYGDTSVDDGIDVLYGLGGEFSFDDNLSVRGTWENYLIDDIEPNLITASVIYNF